MPATNETYSPEEIKRREEAALKRMLTTPHKPHETTRVRQDKRASRGKKP